MSEIFLHSEKILLVFNAQVLGRKAITWVITFHLKNLRSSWQVVMMLLRLNLPRSQQRGQESRLITLGTDFYLKWAGKKVITLFLKSEPHYPLSSSVIVHNTFCSDKDKGRWYYLDHLPLIS